MTFTILYAITITQYESTHAVHTNAADIHQQKQGYMSGVIAFLIGHVSPQSTTVSSESSHFCGKSFMYITMQLHNK